MNNRCKTRNYMYAVHSDLHSTFESCCFLIKTFTLIAGSLDSLFSYALILIKRQPKNLSELKDFNWKIEKQNLSHHVHDFLALHLLFIIIGIILYTRVTFGCTGYQNFYNYIVTYLHIQLCIVTCGFWCAFFSAEMFSIQISFLDRVVK